MANTAAKSAPKRRRRVSLESRQRKWGYIFTFPIIIGLFAIFIPMMVRSFWFSVSELTITKEGVQTALIGFENYHKALFEDENFNRDVITSLGNMAINVPIIIIFSFFMSNVLNQKFIGRTAVRVVFFLPVIISTGVIYAAESADLMLNMYQSGDKLALGGLDTGGFGYQDFVMMLSSSGLDMTFVNIVVGAIDRLYDIITSSGIQLLIFLAGLQSVPNSLFEAAKVEGATQWEIFWKITFPYISPLIIVNLVYTIVDTFLTFKNSVILNINNILKNMSQYSWGLSQAWIYMLVVGVCLVVVAFIVNKFIVYQD